MKVTGPVRALTEVEVLRDHVAVMRELGVTEWNGIKLGPEPPKPGERVARDVRPETAEERTHRIAFAHSSVRPPFVPRPAEERDTPRAAVLRRKSAPVADGARRGPRTSSQG